MKYDVDISMLLEWLVVCVKMKEANILMREFFLEIYSEGLGYIRYGRVSGRKEGRKNKNKLMIYYYYAIRFVFRIKCIVPVAVTGN